MIAGGPEDEVYAAWRAATADEVAAAERERAAPSICRRPRPSGPTASPARSARRRPPRRPRTPRRRGLRRVPPPAPRRGAAALLDSLVEHASRPLPSVGARAAGRPRRPARGGLPGADRQLDPARALGKRGRQLGLVLLPGLMPDAERLVVLPMPAVVTADVAELADLELGPHALAAPPASGPRSISGFGVINAAAEPAARPPGRRGRAAPRGAGPPRLRLRRLQRGVLVLDLGRLRREGFMAEGLGLARDVRAQRRRGPAPPDRAGPGARARALGRRADAHARARPGPAPLGRRRQAVARGLTPERELLAAPRRSRWTGCGRRQLPEQRLPARGDRVEPVARHALERRGAERRRRLLVVHQRAERLREEARAAVRDDMAVDAVGHDVARPGRAVVGDDGQPDGHRLQQHHREALAGGTSSRTPTRSRARRASAGSARAGGPSRGSRACRSAPPARAAPGRCRRSRAASPGSSGASRAQARAAGRSPCGASAIPPPSRPALGARAPPLGRRRGVGDADDAPALAHQLAVLGGGALGQRRDGVEPPDSGRRCALRDPARSRPGSCGPDRCGPRAWRHGARWRG